MIFKPEMWSPIIASLQALAICIGYKILDTIIVLATVINVYMFVRWLRIELGGRSKPSAQKAILITGATSGFGLQMARRFHKLGYAVIAGYFNDREPGFRELSELAAREPARLLLVHMNVRSPSSVGVAAATVDRWLDEHKLELHRLVNNAGTCIDGPFEWCAPGNMLASAETNFVGVLLVTRTFIKRLIQAKGRVVNVSSGLAHTPTQGVPAYGSSKIAVAYFTEALRHDVERHYGVTTCCVIPGYLVSATNISWTRAKSVQESLEQLDSEEVKLYEASTRVYLKYVRRIAMEVLTSGAKAQYNGLPDASETLAQTHGFDLARLMATADQQSPQPPTATPQSGWLARKLDLVSRYVFSGDILGSELDNTYVMEAFVQAVTLKRPPRRLYAGNRLYSLYTGPLADFIPWVVSRHIGCRVMKAQLEL